MLRRLNAFKRMTRTERRERLLRYRRLLVWRLLFASVFLIYIIPSLMLATVSVRFLPTHTIRHFGNLIDVPALHVRARRVDLQTRARGVLLAPRGRPVNEALVDYWRHHYRVITNPVACFLLTPFTWMPFVSENEKTWSGITVTNQDGEELRGGPAVDRIIREHEDRFGDLQVLSLQSNHKTDGVRNLERLGIPSDAWWVALHVREAASLGETVATHRNADITDYFNAVQLIVDRGGWVIRVGDPRMSRLPPMQCVVDDVHSDVQSDWMDLFLSANCRFMLSAGSGALLLPTIFGRPVAAANFTPHGNAPMSRHDLFIPKMYWSVREERFIGFREVFSSPLRDTFRDRVYDRLAIGVAHSTPRQIEDLTREMLDRIGGTASYSDEDERIQSVYKSIWTGKISALTWGTESRIGRAFLRENAYLLG